MLYSGIDLHKRDLVIATVDETGQSVAAKRIRPTNQAVRAYFEQFSPESEHRAVVAATRSWYWLRDVLRATRPVTPVTLTLANPGRLRPISAAKVKTDAVDADTLAQLLRADLILEVNGSECSSPSLTIFAWPADLCGACAASQLCFDARTKASGPSACWRCRCKRMA